MWSRQIRRLGFARGPGLLLAILALVSQLALGSLVLPGDAAAEEQIAALDALSVLCDASMPVPPAHHRNAPDPALCPLSLTLALPAMVLAAGPDVPPPRSRLAGRTILPPPARGPPTQPRFTALPRGPPVPT